MALNKSTFEFSTALFPFGIFQKLWSQRNTSFRKNDGSKESNGVTCRERQNLLGSIMFQEEISGFLVAEKHHHFHRVTFYTKWQLLTGEKWHKEVGNRDGAKRISTAELVILWEPAFIVRLL